MKPRANRPDQHTEDSLERVAEYLSVGVEAACNGVVVIDREGVILVYNQAAKRIFHDRGIEPVGQHMSEVRPAAWPDLNEVLRTGKPQLGKKLILPEATIIANRAPIFEDDRVVGVISIFQDVSEHEKLVSQLQNYRKLHREIEAIFESSYDGIFVTDGEANALRVNAAYERITGLQRDDLIGKNMRSLVQDHIYDHSVTLEVLQKQKPITIMQRIRGGKQVIVTGTPVLTDEGDISAVVTNVRDISELNELRAQIDEYRKMSTFFSQSLQEHHEVDHAIKELVVKSQAMVKVVQKAIKVARVDASVLLRGESGVGKSMLAKLIHKISPRKEHPFVKINCGAIPSSLMESELFGYKKGAFTGALVSGKMGLVAAANKGTLFFDEIAELKLDMQVKLLQVLEEKEFTRIGATTATSVDVHIIAATNRDLKELMQRGLFREDLYYRLNVVPITIPPLRERREDIGALIDSCLEKINRSNGFHKKIDAATVEHLRHYDFPGNVRELINIIERMMVLSEGDLIMPEDLPSEVRNHWRVPAGQTPLKEALENYEGWLLREVLAKSESLVKAAELLQVHPTTLWRKMAKYGLSPEISS
jgi:PAS domain S-box-containing protein